MAIAINKSKLPKGLIYPFKTSLLEKVISENGIDPYIDLQYWTPQSGNYVFEGEFWFPNERVDYPRFFIRIASVKSENRKLISQLLEKELLDKIAPWIEANLELDHHSGHNATSLRARFEEGKLQFD